MKPKTTRYVPLRKGQKRPAGYQYRYKTQVGWTEWLNGDDEFAGQPISPGTGCQYRAPRLR